MSMRTGIFPNAINELSNRVARNSRRQSARAQKAQETQEVAYEAAEIKAKLATEQEARRESSAQTKQLNERLKVLTGKSRGRSSKAKAPAILTASSSGRVKTVAPRSTPSDPPARTHFENVPAEGAAFCDPVRPSDTNIDKTATMAWDLPEMQVRHSGSLAAAGTLFTNPAHGQPAATEFELNLPGAPVGALFTNPVHVQPAMTDFELNLPGAPVGTLFTNPAHVQPAATNFRFTQSVAQPGAADFWPDQSFDALMSATAPTPTDHSMQNLAGFGFAPPAASSGYISSDFTFGTPSAGTPEYSQWPMLPPAQPDSPSAPSIAIEDLSAQSTSTLNTAKKRRQHQEVDPANILKPSSVRSRIPSERKRVGEAEGQGVEVILTGELSRAPNQCLLTPNFIDNLLIYYSSFVAHQC
ncbi:hypothetical protein B0H10DRAFT_2384667 [Mycena sp. CBHHK59/15]|nr:hypothetical protein B0H10DRAFT_2384667 [Mycena sp. CBHHK59/15]